MRRVGGEYTPLQDRGTRAAASRMFLEAIDDPETRRLIVDSRQAADFAAAGTLPPIPDRLRAPFEQMWVEPTEAIVLGEPEPGREPDVLLGMLFGRENHLSAEFKDQTFDGVYCWVTVFLRSLSGATYADSTIMLELGTGRGLTRTEQCVESELTDRTLRMEAHGLIEAGDRHRRVIELMVARTEEEIALHGGSRGWWEARVHAIAELAAWLLSYMTAKGVVIVEQRELAAQYAETRQQRRAAARQQAKHVPHPWHLVTVLPTRTTEHDDEGGSRGVSYRFDVRGHLRYGRHKRADGTYSETIEWVRPHQRGVRHARYVPSTYHYDRGRAPDVDSGGASV